MLVLGLMGIVLTVALAAGVVSGYLTALHRVRHVADLAALSAARQMAAGEAPCPTAERIARGNGAELHDCESVGDAVEFAVLVEVQLKIGGPGVALPREVSARAAAGRVLGEGASP